MKILRLLLAAARTSEFWAVVGQVVVEAISAPVPEEFKTATWVYIGFRIVSKIVKQLPQPAK